MMKNRKIIAMDLDGTALNSKGEMSDRLKNRLKKLKQEGHSIIVATGRPMSGVSPTLLQGDIVSYVVSMNGAKIFSCREKKTVLAQTIPNDSVLKLQKYIQKQAILADLFYEDVGYCDLQTYKKVEEYFQGDYLEYYKKSRCPVEQLWYKNLTQHQGIKKITLFFKDVDLKAEYKEQLQKIPNIRVCSGRADNIEITAADATKGKALQWLCEQLQLDASHLIAFGDSENDRDMLQLAGTSVAMGNAKPEIRQVADYVTKGNDEDGVALFLEEKF